MAGTVSLGEFSFLNHCAIFFPIIKKNAIKNKTMNISIGHLVDSFDADITAFFNDSLSFLGQDPINQHRDVFVIIVRPIDCVELGNDRIAAVLNVF